MGEKAARISFEVQAQGVPYYLTNLKLAAHETRAIDLGALRDKQQEDFRQNRIPAQATDGTVYWTRLDNVPVMGRLVIVSNHGAEFGGFNKRASGVVGGLPGSSGVANFLCYDCACQCPPDTDSMVLNGVPCDLLYLEGQGCSIFGMVGAQDCNGVITYYDETLDSTFTSSDTSVATVDNTTDPATVTGVSPGTADINASFLGSTYPQAPYNCGEQPFQVRPPTGIISVYPTVSVSCTLHHLALGLTAPYNTSTGDCTTTPRPTGGTFAWSANSNRVTLNPYLGTTAYSAANPSSTTGDTSLSVEYTVNAMTSPAASFSPITVHQPTSLSLLGDSTNPTGWDCSAYNYQSYLRTRIFGVMDQLSQSFANSGISSINATESFSNVNSSCGATLNNATAPTNPFQDQFYFCSSACLPGGSGCTTTATHTISVNGLAVLTENVTWTCSTVSVSQ